MLYLLTFDHNNGTSTHVANLPSEPTEKQLREFWVNMDGHDPEDDNEFLNAQEMGDVAMTKKEFELIAGEA